VARSGPHEATLVCASAQPSTSSVETSMAGGASECRGKFLLFGWHEAY